ncbi:hypothetical protein [Halobiforma nitratireducens]|uniref:Uncharacterized protein n=1 Tax=Halobiforma nitratireducens JCM 10879 TaxID=1227454 RepID=M0LTQ5_9EURY|nr:hypothetical protein [Halobiforma nitratireducens]EMA36831.1 hypothetical protein C446_11117 [Halobiforma nitratireducens JCM 10879]
MTDDPSLDGDGESCSTIDDDPSDGKTDSIPDSDLADDTSESTIDGDPAEEDRAGDTSFGGSVVRYALWLTVTTVVVAARIVWAGVRIVAYRLRDTETRGEWRRWLLLEGDRRVIVGGFVAGVFALALVLGLSDVIGVRESRFVTTMFSTMIAGLFSFIPIVVAVNQLIISRLFGTPDRLTDRIDGVQEFRSRVETQTDGDGVSPSNPAPFLARLAGTLGGRADALATECDRAATGETATGDDPPADSATPSSALESVSRFATHTREHTDSLSSRLTGGTESVFDVVLPTIDHDYAGAANEARRLERRFDEELSDRAATLLEDLRGLFVAADATRQYFTTIYLQRELARLSRLITYSGTAAILLSSLVIMIYASGYPPVAFEGWLLVLVSLALAVAFSPLAVLFAYVVRVSAILKRTSAPGAFTLSDTYHGTNGTDGVHTTNSDDRASEDDE